MVSKKNETTATNDRLAELDEAARLAQAKPEEARAEYRKLQADFEAATRRLEDQFAQQAQGNERDAEIAKLTKELDRLKVRLGEPWDQRIAGNARYADDAKRAIGAFMQDNEDALLWELAPEGERLHAEVGKCIDNLAAALAEESAHAQKVTRIVVANGHVNRRPNENGVMNVMNEVRRAFERSRPPVAKPLVLKGEPDLAPAA